MKKLVAMMITAAAFAVGAFAQTPETLKLHLAIPASVSGVVLTPGDYTVRVMDDSGNFVLLIESATSNIHVLALANPIGYAVTLADANRAVLARDGATYRLDKIWVGGEGYEVLSAAAK